jgi:hypothetical protein
VYGLRDRRLTQSLVKEALGFAVCAYVVMWLYRKFFVEGYAIQNNTSGSPCPNGHHEVADPLNPNQMTCVPVGHKTYKEGDIDSFKLEA